MLSLTPPLPNQYPRPVWDPRGTPRQQQIATSSGPQGATDFGVYAAVTGLGNGTPSAYLITAVICLGGGAQRFHGFKEQELVTKHTSSGLTTYFRDCDFLSRFYIGYKFTKGKSVTTVTRPHWYSPYTSLL